jgi:pyrroline-5-carboxylate reductase
MNRIISVTSSSPAYVFLFIKAIYDGAVSQGLETEGLLSAVCDTVIGSAQMLKESQKTPDELIQIVASKGGTTERALGELNNFDFYEAIISAMKKCTERANELGSVK